MITGKDLERWTTKDLEDEMIVDLMWGQYQKMFHFLEFLRNEQQITEQTFEDMVQCLVDLKPVMCKYLLDKKDK
jgi:hypothetical protein